jgi:hypothetical protein
MAIAIVEIIKSLSKEIISTVLFGLALCFFLWAFLSLHTGRINNSHTVTAGFIQNYYHSTKVGAFQSGVIGYFNDNVINLDGKVNQLALDYSRTNELHRYIDSEKIDIIVDWPIYIYESLDNEYLDLNWETCERQIPNDISICLKRKNLTRK